MNEIRGQVREDYRKYSKALVTHFIGGQQWRKGMEYFCVITFVYKEAQVISIMPDHT